MREELLFKEHLSYTTKGQRMFTLKRWNGRGYVALPVYLEFSIETRSWRLARHERVSTKLRERVLMEIAGTNDDPPIDLALATLSFMGY